MKDSFWNKRIPTLFGLFVILIGLITTTFLTNKTQILQTNAENSPQPKDVRITNVSDSSFSVTYLTDAQVSGSLNYGKDKNLGQSALDERDIQTGKLGSYSIHNITVKNLNSSTKYYFTILSGQQAYTTNNQPFEITTGPTLTNSENQNKIVNGKIQLLNGHTPGYAIVYVTIDNAQVLSTTTDANGNYKIPLNILRNSDLLSYFNFTDNSVLKILAIDTSLTSNATIFYSQSNNIPLITLSKDYDFRANNVEVATSSAGLLSFPSEKSISKDPTILSPQKDQQFTNQMPVFKGSALPNQSVKIIIHSDQQIQTNVQTDSSGNWSYRPTTALSPGNHTITLVAKDASGITKTITQSFIVYAADNQTQNSTQSATQTITITNTPTPTTIITPTISASTPEADKPLPPTGNPFIITAGILGLIMSLSGGLLFLLARKNI